MNINNPQVFDHIIDDTGDELRPEELSNAEIAAKTFEAKGVAWENQASGNYHVNRHIVDANDVVMRCIVYEIGDWDMDTDFSTYFPHGLGSDFKKIRSVKAIIRDDLDGVYIPLESFSSYGGAGVPSGCIDQINATNITLLRQTGLIFDNSDYSATSYNRGWVYVWLEV